MSLGHRFCSERLQRFNHTLQSHPRRCNGKNIEQESGDLASTNISDSATLWDWVNLTPLCASAFYLQKLMVASDDF